jgi:glycosyltransferase involved in cell wall biosynthesis
MARNRQASDLAVAIMWRSGVDVNMLGGTSRIIYFQLQALIEADVKVKYILNNYTESYNRDRNPAPFAPDSIEYIYLPEFCYEWLGLPSEAQDPVQRSVHASINQGHVPPEFYGIKDRAKRQLTKAFEGVDVVILHNFLTLPGNFPVVAAVWEIASGDDAPLFIHWTHDLFTTCILQLPEGPPFDGYPYNLLRQRMPNTHYVATTPRLRGLLREALAPVEPPCSVLSNCVDLEQFPGFSRETIAMIEDLDLLSYDYIILYANWMKEGNISLAIDLIAELNKRGRSAVFIHTGAGFDPALYNEIVKKIESRGVREHFIFLSAVKPEYRNGVPLPVLRDLYLLADLYFHLTEQVGPNIPNFELQLVEAGISKTPVLARYLPHLHDVFQDHVMVWAPENTVEETADVVIRHLDSNAAGNFARFIRKNMLLSDFKSKFMALLLGVVNHGGNYRLADAVRPFDLECGRSGCPPSPSDSELTHRPILKSWPAR